MCTNLFTLMSIFVLQTVCNTNHMLRLFCVSECICKNAQPEEELLGPHLSLSVILINVAFVLSRGSAS